MKFADLHASLWPTFAAFLLLFFSCISGAWSGVSFLNVQIDGRNIYFGVFGYTGISQPTLGYSISQAVGPINQTTDSYLGNGWFSKLETGLILHLVATIFTFIAWAIMFWRRDEGDKITFLKFVKISCFVVSGAATFFLFFWDLGIFAAVMHELRVNGIPADLGNANWITLGALIAFLLEPCWILIEPTLPEAWQRRPAATSGAAAGASAVEAVADPVATV